MHVKINEAIDKALRTNPSQPVLHRLNFRRPHHRRRLKPVNLTGRTPMTDDECRVVPHYNRMQLELYNHFEHYNTPTQERTDLLRILNRPEGIRERLKFASAKGFQDFMEGDNLSDLPLIADFWKGYIFLACENIVYIFLSIFWYKFKHIFVNF